MGMNQNFHGHHPPPHHPHRQGYHDMHHEEFDHYNDMDHERYHNRDDHIMHRNQGQFDHPPFHRKERDRERERDREKDRHNNRGHHSRERDHRKDKYREYDEGHNDRDHRKPESKERHKEHKEKDHRNNREKQKEKPQRDVFVSPPQPVRIPHHREDSPVREEEPRLSLESRIASLLRTNSQDSDSSGMPFGSPEQDSSTQPPLPLETPPPLPEGLAPPLPEPPADEPPPLPPEPDHPGAYMSPHVEWVGGGSEPLPPGSMEAVHPIGSGMYHEETPNSYCDIDSRDTPRDMYIDESSRAWGTPAQENISSHGTPLYQEVVVETKPRKRRSLRAGSSDMELEEGDEMSVDSNGSGQPRVHVEVV